MAGFFGNISSGWRSLGGWLLGGWWRPRNTAPRNLDEWASLIVEKIRTAASTGTLHFLPRLDQLTGETQEIRAAYREMLREPTVKAALLTKVLAVAALDTQVHPPDKNNSAHRAQADFVRHNLKRISPHRVARTLLLPALIDGWSLSEKVWEVEKDDPQWKDRWVWKSWRSKDIANIQLGTDAYRNVEAIRGTNYNAGRLFDPDDFVIYSYLDMFENPHGMSDLRAAYRAYWIKNNVWQLRGLHLDKYTSPFLLGSYPAGAADIRVALEAALAQAKSSTWLTIPIGAAVEAITMSTQGTTDFESAIQDCDREMLIGIVGAYLQVLEGKVADGRGDTSVHKETSELFQWLLAAELGDIYTREAAELCKLNFAEPAPPVVTLEAVSEDYLLKRSQVDTALQALGLKLSKSNTYEMYNRSEPTDENDVLAPTSASPASPGTPPAPMPAPAPQAFSEVRRFCGGKGGEPGPCPEGGGDDKPKGQHLGGFKATLADGKELSFVPHPNQRSDETTIMVDPAKLDAEWSKDDKYIPAGGGGASSVKGRREGFEEFLAKGKPIESSRVGLYNGVPYFVDGRHRFSILRDKGAGAVGVTIPKEQAKEIQEKFGVAASSKQSESLPRHFAESLRSVVASELSRLLPAPTQPIHVTLPEMKAPDVQVNFSEAPKPPPLRQQRFEYDADGNIARIIDDVRTQVVLRDADKRMIGVIEETVN